MMLKRQFSLKARKIAQPSSASLLFQYELEGMTHTHNNGFEIKRENTVANHIDTHFLDITNRFPAC